ncbi:DUF885 domain-containing protein [Pseudonocardia sp. KRD291]|uniref:DUF885 domain-containing protein n=1 Tax=Pseudonocardia sp. KRD291 TaxID=2792007 RepID=UPI001C4A4CD5|nr:DUF885 domain-containing protein [Pseudonocardia sp. KRD291]MBW0107023.1 DUF885 domain-containing protein [Pseudonocardia sp. KRD291]
MPRALLLRDVALLALRLDRLVPGLLDGPVADAALRRHVADEPVPDPLVLSRQVERLSRELPGAGLPPRRERYVTAQLRALECRIRIVNGAPVSFPDEVLASYGVPARAGDPDVYRQAHRRLGELLPGTGPLAGRMVGYRERDRIPPERLADAVAAMTAEMRRRTGELIALPAGEEVEHDVVPDRPWTAFTHHLGGHRSRIAVSRSSRLRRGQLLPLVVHEAYPGHHTQYCRAAAAAADRPEMGLRLVHSPQGLLAEGMADAALDVLPGPGWGAVAQEVLADVGLAVDGALAEEVESVLTMLGRARQDAALMRHRDGAGPDEVAGYLSRWLVVDDGRARRMLSFLDHPQWRAYATTYAEGRPLVSAWLARPGTDPVRNLRSLLDEPVTPGDLQRDLERASSAAGVAPVSGAAGGPAG